MVKKIKKWEIVKYEQEVNFREFSWEEIKEGYTVSDRFSNKDYELISSFDSEEEARKEFEEYEMLMSPWISGNYCSLRYIEEYELQCNVYEIDEDGNKEWVDYTWSEFSKIGNDILAEKSFHEMEKYENFECDDLDRLNSKLNDYNFYIDGNNTIEEVFEREKDDDYDAFNVSYKYKDSDKYLHCQIIMDIDINDNIYIDDIDFELN